MHSLLRSRSCSMCLSVGGASERAWGASAAPASEIRCKTGRIQHQLAALLSLHFLTCFGNASRTQRKPFNIRFQADRVSPLNLPRSGKGRVFSFWRPWKKRENPLNCTARSKRRRWMKPRRNQVSFWVWFGAHAFEFDWVQLHEVITERSRVWEKMIEGSNHWIFPLWASVKVVWQQGRS